MPVMDVRDFQYLVGTRHVDDEDGCTYQTTRVLIEGEWLVAYRRLVLKDGTVFQRTEDGPIFVRDIARLTDIAGVGRDELELDDIHSTDPEIVINRDNTSPSSRDALNGGVRVNDMFLKPGQEGTSKSARSDITTSDTTSHSETMYERDQENLSVQTGVKRGGWARNSQQVSDVAQGLRHVPNAKRARVTLSGIRPSEYAKPRTKDLGQPPNLLDRGAISNAGETVKSTSQQPVRQPSVLVKLGAPKASEDSSAIEEAEPKRPGLRPRVRQRLSASALAGNAFSTIAMLVLTVTACSVNPDIAIHPTALQPDPITRAQMLLTSDMREWKDAEEKELNSMRNNNVFTECDLPAGRKTVKTKWIYKKKLNKHGNVERYKARLVAQGFTQVEGIDYSETYSPVARFTSIRIVLALSALFGYKVHQMDVDTAFLNAELKEEVYIEAPPGYSLPPGRVYRLNKCLYGIEAITERMVCRYR